MISINEKERKITNRVLFFIGLLLFAYTVSRAYLLSFTWDESYSYLEFTRKGIFTLSNYNYMAANNHLLNTWLTEFSLNVLGLSEFTLRLPNLLAHLLFLIYSGKLVFKLSSNLLIICSFLILNLNPFVLDFFSLSRGYGLSMGLLMGSLYYAYMFIEGKNSYFYALISILFAALGVLANLTLLNYFLIITALFVIIYIFRNLKKTTLKQVYIKVLMILSPLLILLFIYPIIINLKNTGAFFFGGKTGFWSDTIVSLINESLYENAFLNKFTIVIEIFNILLISISLLVIIYQIRKDKSKLMKSFLVFIFMIIFLNIIANYIQHKSLGILYPKERTAMFYIPLFSLLIVFLLEYLLRHYGKVFKGFIIGFTLLFCTNYLYSLNFHYVISWQNEADAKNMVNNLITNKKEIPVNKFNLSIGSNLFYESDINFYRNRYYLTWLNAANRIFAFNPLNDYYFISKDDLPKISKSEIKILKEFGNSNMLLVSNVQKWNRTEIYSKKLDFEIKDSTSIYNHLSKEIAYRGNYSSRSDSVSKYSDGITYFIDDSLLNHKNSLISVRLMAYSEYFHSDALLVVSFEDSTKSYSYQTVNIKDYLHKEKEWTTVCFTAFVPNEIKKKDKIACYLWNIGSYPVFVDNMEFKVIGYDKISE